MYTSEPTNTMSPFTFFHTYISTSSIPVNIPLKKKHATLLTKSTTSYYNLHQPSPKIASHLHIFLGRLELNHDPLWSHQGPWLHRSIASSFQVLLDGSTTNGQQLIPHTEPLLFGPRTCLFFGGGQRFPSDFRQTKITCSKNYSSFQADQPPIIANVAIQTHIVKGMFWRCHILKTMWTIEKSGAIPSHDSAK